MTIEECEARIKTLVHTSVSGVDGVDLRVEHSRSWSWKSLQELAVALGTEQIDMDRRGVYDTLPQDEMIAARYEYEGGGCPSCGYGSIVIVRGIITMAQ